MKNNNSIVNFIEELNNERRKKLLQKLKELEEQKLKLISEIEILKRELNKDEKYIQLSTEENVIVSSNNPDPDWIARRDLLNKNFDNISLTVRCLTCLRHNNIFKVGELVSLSKSDVYRFRNLGKKTLKEIEDFLTENNLSFGMDIEGYMLLP